MSKLVQPGVCPIAIARIAASRDPQRSGTSSNVVEYATDNNAINFAPVITR
ncbi:hypothetical protein TFLX_06137 [Thermoflexales bacterium]|nr:hypothetical protein TFLX_06137 [Thermoflexales bacterium]